ncbi:hypothetical protein FVD38_08065 [Massilia arenae]|uniref:Uncharacterized protein n=1 Tax=Massilia arenae TaxID=2603288 RepID=A0A5C7G5L4_9BURK|nr:hypothetical protein FVD38_08065 [Massilia arenae]
MNPQIIGAAKRLILSLLVACGLGGCVAYGPPYAAYDGAYAPAYGYSNYPAYPYYGAYPYGSPAYAYPPVTLGLEFSYYDRGPRHYGHGHHHGSGHYHGSHGWRGHHGGHGGRHHGGHGHGRGHPRR